LALRIDCVTSSSLSAPPLTRRLDRPLILDGLCLHVLSSFQRTGIRRSFARSTVDADRVKTNLSNLRQSPPGCQPLCRLARSRPLAPSQYDAVEPSSATSNSRHRFTVFPTCFRFSTDPSAPKGAYGSNLGVLSGSGSRRPGAHRRHLPGR
jgi:hypothetical protein